MRKLFLLLTLFAVGSLSAQGNGDYVNMTFVKTTPGEAPDQSSSFTGRGVGTTS